MKTFQKTMYADKGTAAQEQTAVLFWKPSCLLLSNALEKKREVST